MSEPRHSYVIGIDTIPAFCADCEQPIPEAGKVAPWLYRMSITHRGTFHTDGLCPDCALQLSPALTATLAAAWREHHAVFEAAGDAH